jgi:hypothetical protein
MTLFYCSTCYNFMAVSLYIHMYDVRTYIIYHTSITKQKLLIVRYYFVPMDIL